MATVDNLEIQIQSTLDDVNKSLDVLVQKLGLVTKGISAIKNNKGLEDFAKQAESISASMHSVQNKAKDMAKSIEAPIKKVAKTFEQISEQYKDYGKGFKPISQDLESSYKELRKYENELEKARGKEEKFRLGGETGTKKYENAVADIQRYTNYIENVKKQISDMEAVRKALTESVQKLYEIQEREAKESRSPWENLEPTSQVQNSIKAFSENAEKEIDKVREKIQEISNRFKESGKDFYFEGNAEQLEKQIQQVSAELDKLYSKQDRMIELGEADAKPFRDLIRDIENAQNRLQILEDYRPEALNRTLEENAKRARLASERLREFGERLNQLEVPEIREENLDKLRSSLGKTEAKLDELRTKLKNKLTMGNITESVDDKGFVRLREQIAYTEKYAEALRTKIQQVGNVSGIEKLKSSMAGLQAFSKNVSQAFSKIVSALKKFDNAIKSVVSKIGKMLKSMLLLGNTTKKTNSSFSGGLKTVLKYGLRIRSLYILFNKLRSAIKEGMENLVQYSERTNASVSALKSSLTQLKNASAAMVSPLLNALAPALNQIIQLCIKAANAVNQLIAALTGQSTWIRATKLTEDYAESVANASKEAKNGIRAFDELNVITTQSETGATTSPEDMFETVSVESKFQDLANKVKDVLEPIEKIVKNIISNFQEAWESGNTGLHILENIKNIFSAIASNIKEAINYTVEWSANLNFTPLLEAFERFTASLVPMVDALSGVLTDFYTMVLLPLGKWTLEKGLPELLDVFTAFNEKVDWESLRTNLAEFWTHLEPFSETVGEGLIIFIGRVSDALAEFLNSETFVNFLHELEDWMDSVKPEDIADGIEKLAKAFVGLKIALVGLSALIGVLGFLAKIANIATALQGINLAGFATTLAGILSVISGVILAVTNFVTMLKKGFSWLNEVLMVVGVALAAVGAVILGVPAAIAAGVAAVVAAVGTIVVVVKDNWDAISGFFVDLWDSIVSIWNTVASWFDKNVIEPIVNFFVGLATRVQQIFEGLWIIIQAVWVIVSDWFNEKVITPIVNFFSPIVETLSDFFSEAWENIKSIWSVVSDWFKNNIIAPVLNVFKTACDAIGGFFASLWSGIKKGVASAMNTVIVAIEGAINWLVSGINDIIGGFNRVVSWAASIIEVDWGGVDLLPKVSLGRINISGYATGGFPEDGLFYANHTELVGKFSNGKTAVANNEQITQGIAEAIYPAVYNAVSAAMRNNSNNNENTVIQVNLDGDVVYRNIVKRTKQMPNAGRRLVLAEEIY